MVESNRQAASGEKASPGAARCGFWHGIGASLAAVGNQRKLVEQMSQCRELTRAFRFVFR